MARKTRRNRKNRKSRRSRRSKRRGGRTKKRSSIQAATGYIFADDATHCLKCITKSKDISCTACSQMISTYASAEGPGTRLILRVERRVKAHHCGAIAPVMGDIKDIIAY